MSDRRHATSWRVLAIMTAILLIPQSLVGASGPQDWLPSDAPTIVPGAERLEVDEEQEERLEELDFAILSKKLAGDRPLSLDQAAAFRSAAAHQANEIRKNGVPPAGPSTFQLPWSAVGPNPIGEIPRSELYIEQMNGRIGALLIHPDTGELILGGAQGGIWTKANTDQATPWVPRTDTLPSLAIGALAIAPSEHNVVYAGTGEGALSGDSYFGNGVLKSTDGGHSWTHISGDYFVGVSISRLVVDPNDADHLYVSVLRGRGGARRTSPAIHSKFGIWESNNGGTSWTLLEEAPKNTNGATDLEMDPQQPNVMYTSFWGDKVYKSTDGGDHWTPIMNGLPNQFNAANLTRFSIGLSHPDDADAVLYVGTDFFDAAGDYQQSRLWRSDDEGTSWDELPTTGFTGPNDSVLDYCGGQCFYDNVVEADPTNTDIVYAGGQFNYGIGSGGQFRSDDGGQTWKNMGWNQHPDYHAFAFAADPDKVLIGSDGGVWWSPDRGGRLPGALDEGDISAVTWTPINAAGLQVAQFTSIATNPSFPGRERMWGGTQDNGTMRKSAISQTWFDAYSGDGGQVLVDPNDWTYVYGTYFGISPYRDVNGGSSFFQNQFIRTGLNTAERSDFYVPFVMNKENTSQLFLGTYRLYRTDNAKAVAAVDVLWKPISPDLTSGCTGPAPNGARNCTVSAIGIGGGTAVYTGSLDGYVYLSTDAKVSNSPTWTRLDQNGLPKRPIAQIAVDRSNYRIAYFAYNGFNAATPGRSGHVFKTTDGGQHFTNISGNLPDTPVNSVILDPSYPNTLYVGTDVGPFVTYDGGVHWSALGTGGFPIVGIWQMDLDTGVPAGANAAGPRTLLAGTHGRGAFRMQESLSVPALMVSKVDAGVPVGPNSALTYTLTVKNIGNGAASLVSVTDPIPANTTFMSADNGGTQGGGKVTWSGISLAAGASIDLHLTVSIAPALKAKIKSITNDGITVTSAQGQGTTGSPTTTPIAPPYGVSLLPASQANQARPGTSVSYALTMKNLSFNTDSFAVTTAGGFTAHLYEADCSTALPATVGPMPPGATHNLCVTIDVPADAANNAVDTTTVTATSAGNPSVSASATLATTSAAAATLLVDQDGDAPNVQSYYAAALTAAGVEFNTWDLRKDPNLSGAFLNSYTNVIWFTGNSYPGPLIPYEARLAAFLDGGGNLFISGQDALDQEAGETAFVHDYLHIDWDDATQNDRATASVHEVATTLTDGLGTVALDHSVLGNSFEDRITPINGAIAIFTDDGAFPDGVSFTGTYRVVFLAFPLEAYGSAAQKQDVIERVMSYFSP